jgi:hypothetical protein
MRIGRREGAGEVAAAIIEVGELDAILVAASIWRRGRPALLGQWCRGSPLDCARPVEVGYAPARLDAAAAELWRRAQGGAGAAFTLLADERLVRRESEPLAPAPAGPWWRSRWLWIGAGGVAISAAAAALLLGSDEGGLTWAPTFDGCEFGGC